MEWLPACNPDDVPFDRLVAGELFTKKNTLKKNCTDALTPNISPYTADVRGHQTGCQYNVSMLYSLPVRQRCVLELRNVKGKILGQMKRTQIWLSLPAEVPPPSSVALLEWPRDP